MKRSLSALCLGFILLAAGCGRNTPEAVALRYIEAMRIGDTELFRSLLSFDSTYKTGSSKEFVGNLCLEEAVRPL